jgi:hypothetical protein
MCRGDTGKGVKTRPQLENSRVDFSSGMENVLPCHAKLMEMARAKMQFASEFARRLAAVRSPVEFSVSLHKQADWHVPNRRKWLNSVSRGEQA